MIDPLSLRGSATGVFAGISSVDYGIGMLASGSLSGELEGYMGTGSAGAWCLGRVAYTFGLGGPGGDGGHGVLLFAGGAASCV